MSEDKSLKALMDLSGRSALITGGAGHIGRRAAMALAELGANVAIIDIDQQACDTVAAQVGEAFGTRTVGIATDLADDAAVRGVPDSVAQSLGGVDVLVNVAAFVGTSSLQGWVVPFEDQTVETWRAAMDVNLTSVFSLVQAALPHLKKSGRGSIVNMSSVYGMVGPDMGLYAGTKMGNPAAYAASKGALLQLTRWLSTVLAPDVRVNAVTPGGIWRNQDETFVKRYEAKVPLGRMGTEEDLKGAIAFLASDLSSYVTGQNIVVDGGFTSW